MMLIRACSIACMNAVHPVGTSVTAKYTIGARSSADAADLSSQQAYRPDREMTRHRRVPPPSRADGVRPELSTKETNNEAHSQSTGSRGVGTCHIARQRRCPAKDA